MTNTPSVSNLGDRIKHYRTKLGLTQTDLETQSGVKREYISSVEIGRIKLLYPEMLNPLQRVLRFPGWELCDAMGYRTGGDGGTGLDPELVQVLRRLSSDQQKAMIPFATAAAEIGTTVLPTADTTGLVL